VRAALERERPEVVFNCAAYNAVDAAESDPETAFAVNARGPAVLAAECSRLGARLVHFSTNYVFDGAAEHPYREDDEPSPQSVYARSKREGELAVLSAGLVVRTAGVYGQVGSAVKGASFPERILARARAGQPLRVVDDQHLNPTYARDLAAGALALVAAGSTGLVHLVAEGCCSWRELAVETLRLAGVAAEVEAITTAALAAAAPRPFNGCLESSRVSPLRSWRAALKDYWEAVQTRSAVDTQPM
jgi:dTDP-4-dehydrorhamnose reductase